MKPLSNQKVVLWKPFRDNTPRRCWELWKESMVVTCRGTAQCWNSLLRPERADWLTRCGFTLGWPFPRLNPPLPIVVPQSIASHAASRFAPGYRIVMYLQGRRRMLRVETLRMTCIFTVSGGTLLPI